MYGTTGEPPKPSLGDLGGVVAKLTSDGLEAYVYRPGVVCPRAPKRREPAANAV